MRSWVMFTGAMSAAAVKRMRRRPWPVRPARAHLLREHRPTDLDRRRIPLEGKRKTAEWFKHQQFLAAIERIQRNLDRHAEQLISQTSLSQTTYTPTVIIMDNSSNITETAILDRIRYYRDSHVVIVTRW